MEIEFSSCLQMDHIRRELDSLREEMQPRVALLENICTQLTERCCLLESNLSDGSAKISILQERCDALEDELDKEKIKSNYLDARLENQQWKYVLDVPEVQSFLTLGYEEDEAEATRDFIIDMKQETTDMRRGETSNWMITLLGVGEGFIPHNDVLLPHWEEFARSLLQYQRTLAYLRGDDDATLTIENIELCNAVLHILSPALNRAHFTEAQFICIQFGSSGIEFLTSYIQDNTFLRKLYWAGNPFRSCEDVARFCAALSTCPSLKFISITDCDNESDIINAVLENIKNKTLETLDLSDNNISNLKGSDVSELLLSNPSLRELNLARNPMNNQDATFIADALKQNPNLRSLDLDGCNQITLWDNFNMVTFDASSLNSASDSNHHFRISSQGVMNRQGNRYNDPALNRRKKIYLMLSLRNRRCANVQHFHSDRIRIKHLPNVLTAIQPYSEHYLGEEHGEREGVEVEPLSIVYEIMRGWKISILYNVTRYDDAILDEDMEWLG